MNRIKLSGKVLDTPLQIHSYNKEVFYKFYIESFRKSGRTDVLPCVIPESLMNRIEFCKSVTLYGEVRTRNIHTDGKSHLEVYVKVNEVSDYYGPDVNEVVMPVCFICKQIGINKTFKGETIADVVLASNREGDKHSDYIPAIVWNDKAYVVSDCPIGTELSVVGNLRSRVYSKKYDDGFVELKTAYELSITNLEVNEREK